MMKHVNISAFHRCKQQRPPRSPPFLFRPNRFQQPSMGLVTAMMALLRVVTLGCSIYTACACGSCETFTKETVGGQLLQRRIYKKSVLLTDDHLEAQTEGDDDDDDGDDEPLPVFDNSPGQNGNGKPLSACQGSCDSDEDCEGDLQCIKPKFVGWDGIVPGCRSDGFNKPLWAFKYCAPTPPEGALESILQRNQRLRSKDRILHGKNT